MKKLNVWVLISMALIFASCSQGVNTKVNLKNGLDSASYALGVNTGSSYSSAQFPGEELDVDKIVAGFAQAIKGNKTLISSEDALNYLNDYFQRAMDAEAMSNLKTGEDFLAKNKNKNGIVVTESGLQYQVIKEGSGAKPALTDNVTVHYTGKLLDGTVFDSSIGGDPVTFQVGQVIPGWTEALQLMSVGSKYRVWIPAYLAYGEGGTGPIPASSVLDFEVELISISK